MKNVKKLFYVYGFSGRSACGRRGQTGDGERRRRRDVALSSVPGFSARSHHVATRRHPPVTGRRRSDQGHLRQRYRGAANSRLSIRPLSHIVQLCDRQ